MEWTCASHRRRGQLNGPAWVAVRGAVGVAACGKAVPQMWQLHLLGKVPGWLLDARLLVAQLIFNASDALDKIRYDSILLLIPWPCTPCAPAALVCELCDRENTVSPFQRRCGASFLGKKEKWRKRGGPTPSKTGRPSSQPQAAMNSLASRCALKGEKGGTPPPPKRDAQAASHRRR